MVCLWQFAIECLVVFNLLFTCRGQHRVMLEEEVAMEEIEWDDVVALGVRGEEVVGMEMDQEDIEGLNVQGKPLKNETESARDQNISIFNSEEESRASPVRQAVAKDGELPLTYSLIGVSVCQSVCSHKYK